MTVRTSKSQLRMKRICKHGVYWKRVNMSSGRRGDQQTKQTKSEESQSSVTVERAVTV